MTGPSAQQLQLQDQQMAFYQEGTQHAQTVFAEHQDLLKQMEAVYKPILAKGPSQEGFSAPEKAALTSQAIEGTARNYSQAARAVNNQIAAEGGGNNPLPSGGSEQLREEVASASAGEQSREETQITEADYATGRENFNEAGRALSVEGSQLNPTGYADAATSSGSAAEKTASDINAEQNSWMAPVLGAVGAIGGAVATGGMSNLGAGKGFFG